MVKYYSPPETLETDRDSLESLIKSTEYAFKGDLFGGSETNLSLSQPFTSPDGKYRWQSVKDFFIYITDLTKTGNIKVANAVLYDNLAKAPKYVEFKGAEKSPVDQTLPQKGILEQFEKEMETKEAGRKKVVEESDRQVRAAIEKQKEVYKATIQEQIKQAKEAEVNLKGKKIYVKVEDPDIEQVPEVKSLKEQAEVDPKKFIEDASKEFGKNPNIKDLSIDEQMAAAKQASLTSYEVLTNNSPLVQAAVINKVASDPNTKNYLENAAASLVNQKMSQLELSKVFFDSSKIDGHKNINDINVEISYTPKPGFKEYDLNEQIIRPHLENLNHQNLLVDTFKDFSEGEIKSRILLGIGGRIEAHVAKLPAGSLVAKAYRSDVVQLGMSSMGFVRAVPVAAVEGSIVGEVITASGLGNAALVVQAKTGINLGVKLAAKTSAETAVKVGVETTVKAGVSTAAKTGFKGLLAKIGTSLFGTAAGGPIGFIATWIGTDVLLKLVEKIPWGKIKKFGVAIASFIVGVPMLAIGLTMANAPLTLGGFGLTAFGAASAKGLTLAGTVGGAFKLFGVIGTATLGAIGGPILSFLIGFPLVVALILFIINSGAYVVPESSLSYSKGQDNPYLSVTKEANPGKISNPSGNQPVSFTVSVTATKTTLTNVKIESTSCNVIKKDGSNVGCPLENIQELPADLKLSPGNPYVFDFSVDFGSNLSDSLVFDSIKISADSDEQKGITTSGSETVCVGECPVDCVKVEDNAMPWPGNLRANLEAAVASLSGGHPGFIAKVCSNNKEVNLCYNPPQISEGYFAWHIHTDSCDVVFNQKGLQSEKDALFLVTHELTHHIQKIVGGSVQEYLDSGGFRELAGEGFCTYKDTANDVYESMAEALGLYASIPSWGGCAANYRTKYPRNYVFAEGFMK
jgi:hypothetical protein